MFACEGQQHARKPCHAFAFLQICLTPCGLDRNTRYEVVLPAGSSYSTVSPGSALRTELRFRITGVLDFTTSFSRRGPEDFDASSLNDLSNSIRSAVIELWYPHGFAPGTDPEDLRSVLSLQEIQSPFGGPETPQDLDFNVTFRHGTTCVAAATR